MAGRRKSVLDVREMVRRFKRGESDRRIAHDLGANRRSITKYRKFALAEGWIAQPELPSAGEIEVRLAALAPPTTSLFESSVEPYRAKVLELRTKGVEITALWLILKDQFGFTGHYSSVRRFVHRLEPDTPEGCTRVETPPGEEAQIDFGYVGEFLDRRTGKKRRAWVFVMTLGFSRHQYAEIVFDQKVATWLALHVRAFEWFGGFTQRLVIDNLKSAITRACIHDPEVQRSYREFAEAYDFSIAPCRPATPEHKGKVESGVRYVKRNALAGREFPDVDAANAHLKHWILTTAGLRDHGTIHEQPLVRFEIEKPLLQPLPAVRYELAVWARATLHPDCHVVFDKAYYSAPHRLIGQKLLLRATDHRVEIYHEHERVATHPRATRPGERISQHDHYPPYKLAGLLATPVRLREQAQAVGEATSRLIEEMLSDKPVDRLRAAQGILNFQKRYGPARLEAACRRALCFGSASYRTLKSILVKDLDREPLPPEAVASGPLPKTALFARPAHEIAANF